MSDKNTKQYPPRVYWPKKDVALLLELVESPREEGGSFSVRYNLLKREWVLLDYFSHISELNIEDNKHA